MSEAKFTEGEWVFNPAKSIYRATISVNGSITAVFAEPPSDGDARLIESAPKMHEILSRLQDFNAPFEYFDTDEYLALNEISEILNYIEG